MKLKRLIFLVAVLFLLSITMADALTVSGTKHNETDVKTKYDWRYSTGNWFSELYQDLTRIKNYSIFTPYKYPFYDSESGVCSPYSQELKMYDYPPALKFGHRLSEIWVSVNGKEDTMLNYLKDSTEKGGSGLCGSSSAPYSKVPANFVGHLASEIEIAVNGNTKSLQQAIDSGAFCKKCGDGFCNLNEDCSSCPADCGNLAQYPYKAGEGRYYCNGGCLKLYLGGIAGGHTQEQCLSSNGEIQTDSYSKTPYCEFASQSCPAGWSYKVGLYAGNPPVAYDRCGKVFAGISYGLQGGCSYDAEIGPYACLASSFPVWQEGSYCSVGFPESRTTTLCY